jgi:hypothetical protein
MICYQKTIRRVGPAVGKPHLPTIFRMQSHLVGHSPIWPQPVAKLQFYTIAQPPVAQLEDRTYDDSSKSSRSTIGPRPVTQLPAETTDTAIWQRAVAKSARDQRTNVGPACRAGLSSNARTASERTFIQHRRAAPGSTSHNRRSRHAAKSSSARSTYRTQSMPAANTNTLSTLSP